MASQSKERFLRIRKVWLQADLEELEAAKAREADPLERAKRQLRSRGFNTYSQIVLGGPEDRFNVGKHKGLSAAQVIAMAARIGRLSPGEANGKGKGGRKRRRK